MKRILFINAVDTAQNDQTYIPSLGLASLATVIDEAFDCSYEIKIVDRNVEAEIINFQPHIVGISCVSQNFELAKAYAKLAKDWGAFVILGGIHITSLPDTLPSYVDVGVMGEGEVTIVELLKNLEKDNWRYINGIVYHLNGQIIENQPRAIIQDLDSLPMVDRSYLPKSKHAYIFTSRGCPYRCTFCASSRYWNKLRFNCPEKVIGEIFYLSCRGVTSIEIWDDLFVADRQRLIAIVDGLSLIGLHKIEFSCQVRANLVDDELAELLKRMNVKQVGIGFESGNDRILRYLKPEAVTVEDNRRAVKILNKHGIAVWGSFVIGSPDETEAEITDTYNFIRDNELSGFSLHILTPLPNTPVWGYAKERGLVSESMDFSRLKMMQGDNLDNSIILSQTVSRKSLNEWYQDFMKLRKQKILRYAIKNPIRTVKKLWKKI